MAALSWPKVSLGTRVPLVSDPNEDLAIIVPPSEVSPYQWIGPLLRENQETIGF